MSRVERLRWASAEPVDFGTAADAIRKEGLEPISWSNPPGDRYPAHAHAYDKLLYCAAGSINFSVGDPARDVDLQPGDGLRLPAGTRHAAVVGPGGCTCVEGHRPP